MLIARREHPDKLHISLMKVLVHLTNKADYLAKKLLPQQKLSSRRFWKVLRSERSCQTELFGACFIENLNNISSACESLSRLPGALFCAGM